MFEAHQKHFSEARGTLQHIIDGKWWSDYATLLGNNHELSPGMNFALGRVDGHPVILRVVSHIKPRAFAWVDHKRNMLGVGDALAALYGPSGEPLGASPRELIEHILLDLEARVDCLWRESEGFNRLEHVRECIKFEQSYFELFAKEIAHMQSLPQWYMPSAIKRWLLKRAVQKW